MVPTMLDQARSRILSLLDRPGMNKVLLADRAGVHRNTLNGIEQANWNPTASTLEAILAAVDRLEKA